MTREKQGKTGQWLAPPPPPPPPCPSEDELSPPPPGKSQSRRLSPASAALRYGVQAAMGFQPTRSQAPGPSGAGCVVRRAPEVTGGL